MEKEKIEKKAQEVLSFLEGWSHKEVCNLCFIIIGLSEYNATVPKKITVPLKNKVLSD